MNRTIMRKKNILITVGIGTGIVILAIALLLKSGMGDKTVGVIPEDTISETTAAMEKEGTEPKTDLNDSEAVAEITVVDDHIHTPFGALYYPTQWADYLIVEKTEMDPYTVSFFAKLEEGDPLRLFDIYFDSVVGEYLGQIVTDYNVAVPVSMKFYAITPEKNWSEEEIVRINEMQDTVNELIKGLPFPAGENLGDIVIDTPYGELYYPAKWEDFLHLEFVDGNPYIVEFYGRFRDDVDLHLVSVCFGEELDRSIGTIVMEDGRQICVDVRYVNLEFSEEWTESEKNRMYEMQEDINYLLEKIDMN